MAFINLTVVFGFAQERALNCCAVIIVCDVDPPVLEPKRGLCRGHSALFVKRRAHAQGCLPLLRAGAVALLSNMAVLWKKEKC